METMKRKSRMDIGRNTNNTPNLKSRKDETIMQTIRRKNKVTISVLGGVGILLIAALLLVPTTQARAETVKYNYTSQLTKVEWIPVGDEKGHILGFIERRGVAFFEDEVAAVTIRCTFEKSKGIVSFEGYNQLTFKDGSTTMQKIQGTHAPPPGEKLDLYEGKGEYVMGTGRFEGIKGKISFTGRLITPSTKDETKGDNWMEVTATSSLPKK